MGFFFLLAAWGWIRFINEPTGRRWRYYALALLCQALALFAKTIACTLPAALLLILWLEKLPVTWRRLAQVAPFAAMGLGLGLVTMWWEAHHQGAPGALFAIGPMERLLIASRALWFYAGKLLWPANLAFNYPRWTIAASDPRAYGWLLATALLAVVIWRARSWAGRGIVVAAAFFAATLSPLLGFIMIYTFQYSFVADHYQYLACIGPIALFAAALTTAWGRLAAGQPFLRAVLCGAMLLALGVLTWQQCKIYANVETLWRATLARNPDSWLANNNLGTILRQKGRIDDAITHYRKALQIMPGNESVHFNLARAYYQQGRMDLAIGQFQSALNLAPGDVEARNNLAWCLATSPQASLRNGAEAVQLARQANALAGGRNPVILGTLAAAFAETGQFGEAAQTAQKAIQAARAAGRQDLAARLNGELQRYEAGLPLHQ
jgi:tetratricopeptide (TPR) repeat protein